MSRGFRVSTLSTYYFYAFWLLFYKTLPHIVIKETHTDLIQSNFRKKGSLYIACNDKNAFFSSDGQKGCKLWSCQNVCDSLPYLLDNIFIIFVTMLHRQIMLRQIVVDFLFCFVRKRFYDVSCLFLRIHKLILLKLLIQLPDIWTTFYILTILTLKVWSLKCILLNCNWKKLILLIPKPHFIFAFINF